MRSNHIFPQKHLISKIERNKLTGNKSFVLWFTGLSGSGKSTIANELEHKLHSKGILTFILDGDNIRGGLNKDLGFSDEDRKENIRRIGEVSKLLCEAGIVVLTAFISPFRKDRLAVRNMFDRNEFIEIYLNCPIAVCEERDVKGLYGKARIGEITDFTGISSPFEEPENPEIIVNTNEESLEKSVNKIYDFILKKL